MFRYQSSTVADNRIGSYATPIITTMRGYAKLANHLPATDTLNFAEEQITTKPTKREFLTSRTLVEVKTPILACEHTSS